jgi:hypothetical protein
MRTRSSNSVGLKNPTGALMWSATLCPQLAEADINPKKAASDFDLRPIAANRRANLLRCTTQYFLPRCGRVAILRLKGSI